MSAVRGALHQITATEPVGEPVEASAGMLGGEDEPTAVLQMAAAGPRHVPAGRRDLLFSLVVWPLLGLPFRG